ncbi:hypothetical protein AB3480_17195 [Rhizobium mongolense]|uniref:hypothetical protein n=1 Tax=Rhizobium mongolense TaxID=57676 RepID=UPI0034A3D0B8
MVADGTRTLASDGADRLASFTQNGAPVSFAYGPTDARMKKSSSTTLYPDANVEMDRADPANAMIPRYPHPEIKITVTAAGSPPALSFLHRDHLASMRPRHRRRRKHAGDAAYGERTNECYDQCLALRPPAIARFMSSDDCDPPTMCRNQPIRLCQQ